MGCQNSRLVHTDVLAIPPKLRPLLWRKVEEIRRRRGHATAPGATLSKKELLREGATREESEAFSNQSVGENESSSRDNDHNSVSSSGSPPEKTQPNNNVSDETEKPESIEERHEKDDGEISRENGVFEEIFNVAERVGIEENVDKDEDEDSDDNEDKRNICPGSPSFRVYYIESLIEKKKLEDQEVDHPGINEENKEEEEELAHKEEEEDMDEMQKKWSTASSTESESVVTEDHEQHEDHEMKSAGKRVKSRTRITRAICRGPVAMKHLLHVSSCYHPSSERASLLNKKISP